jgi:hypothetical protein
VGEGETPARVEKKKQASPSEDGRSRNGCRCERDDHAETARSLEDRGCLGMSPGIGGTWGQRGTFFEQKRAEIGHGAFPFYVPGNEKPPQ